MCTTSICAIPCLNPVLISFDDPPICVVFALLGIACEQVSAILGLNEDVDFLIIGSTIGLGPIDLT